jgi:hypothetical protein
VTRDRTSTCAVSAARYCAGWLSRTPSRSTTPPRPARPSSTPAATPTPAFPAGAADTSPTADLEALRGELARLLHDHSADRAEYRFGDQITALHDDGYGVDVEFARRPGRRFDAVVIAEGSRSRSRDLVFPDPGLNELGLLFAFATIPRTAADDRQWRIYDAGRGRLVHLRPDNVGTTRAMPALRRALPARTGLLWCDWAVVRNLSITSVTTNAYRSNTKP